MGALNSDHSKPKPSRRRSNDDSNINNNNSIMEYYVLCRQNFQMKSDTGRLNKGYTGLYNLGNTCFMNSTLQPLLNTPRLQEIFTSDEFFKHISKLENKGYISACFSALMDSVWSGHYTAIRPSKIFGQHVCADLANKEQHDAHEFQCYFLDALHEDTNQVIIPVPFQQDYDGSDLIRSAQDFNSRQNRFASSIVNDIFNLRTISQIVCSNCCASSVNFEDTNQLSVEIPQQTCCSTLNECLSIHFSNITLSGQNGWNCPKCKQMQMANKNTKIWSLPHVLIIHLKRFQLSGQTFAKNELLVKFEAETLLNMTPYMHNLAETQNANYTLYAITNHRGSLDGGHYTSYIRNRYSKEWLAFDDEVISSIAREYLASEMAYILYFTNQEYFT